MTEGSLNTFSANDTMQLVLAMNDEKVIERWFLVMQRNIPALFHLIENNSEGL